MNYYLMQRDYGHGAKSRRGMQRTRSSPNPKIDSDLSRALERLALREETSYDDIYASSSSGPESPSYMYASDTHRRRHNLRSILKAPPPPLSKDMFKKASVLNKCFTGRRSVQRNSHKVTFATDSDSEDYLTEEEREMRKKVEDYNRFQRAQREERQRADIMQLSNFKSKEDRDSYDRELAMQDYYARYMFSSHI